MPIKRENGFLVTRDIGVTPSLGIETARLALCLERVKSKKLSGVFGSPCFGFAQDNLDFLAQIPKVIQVWFWDVKLKSIEGLYNLRDLTYCGIHPKRPGINFSKFPLLDTLVLWWNCKDEGLAKSNIKDLMLWHYNPKHRTFEGLKFPPHVASLEISWANPESLAGVPRLDFLSKLEIHRCRNLRSLSQLPAIAPNLKKLIVTTCGKLCDLDGIRNHPNLSVAIVDGVTIKG